MNVIENKPLIECMVKTNTESVSLQQSELLNTVSSSNEETTTIEFEVLSSDEFSIETQSGDRSNLLFQAQPKLSTNAVATNKKPALWSRPAIYYLIDIYKRLARDEMSGRKYFGPIVIWTEVSRKLRRKGFIFTPEHCRTKWLLLEKLYQHIRTEAQLQKFEFIEQIHEYYKDPAIEKLLEIARKNVTNEKKKRFNRKMNRLEKVGSKNEMKNPFQDDITETKSSYYWKDCVCENNSQQEYSNGNTLKAIDEIDNVQFGSTSEVNINFDESASTPQDLKSEGSSSFENDISAAMRTDDFLSEYRKIIAEQEKRRDERHQEKLHLFREYNERLLAQQEEAIIMHRELMERLISSL